MFRYVKDTAKADWLTIGHESIGNEFHDIVEFGNENRPPPLVGGDSNLCSAVSYFSTRVGSIIGAGRLSFRVRDGSGRFPVAMYRRNFIHSF